MCPIKWIRTLAPGCLTSMHQCSNHLAKLDIHHGGLQFFKSFSINFILPLQKFFVSAPSFLYLGKYRVRYLQINAHIDWENLTSQLICTNLCLFDSSSHCVTTKKFTHGYSNFLKEIVVNKSPIECLTLMVCHSPLIVESILESVLLSCL